MTLKKQNEKFGDSFLISLTNEERRYLALSPIYSEWDTETYHTKTNLWYTKVTAFFDGNTIVKVISETKRILDNGLATYENYVEYDTKLDTDDRKLLLPLTQRGKAKPLSASNINAIMPFGCSFALVLESDNDTFLELSNPRANKRFPVGEWDTVAAIRSEADLHNFMKSYIDTCREDYFDKLKAFRSAKKVTVKYKVGDIFRMDLDRTRYCYGIITADIKKLKAMPELPEKHSLRSLMTVPIMVRYYQTVTDDPSLKAKDLCQIPLSRVNIVSDNDIIWGTHTVIDHKTISEDDLEFNFICTTRRLFQRSENTLYIEWGFANTELRYEQISDKLKEMLLDYTSPHFGVNLRIDPQMAVPDQKHRNYYSYKNNLLNPENKEMLNEIFFCLGLSADTTFDQFAKKFGGLTRAEIASRIK